MRSKEGGTEKHAKTRWSGGETTTLILLNPQLLGHTGRGGGGVVCSQFHSTEMETTGVKNQQTSCGVGAAFAWVSVLHKVKVGEHHPPPCNMNHYGALPRYQLRPHQTEAADGGWRGGRGRGRRAKPTPAHTHTLHPWSPPSSLGFRGDC